MRRDWRALTIIAALGVLNGVILAGPRIYFAMAREGLALNWLGAIHPLGMSSSKNS